MHGMALPRVGVVTFVLREHGPQHPGMPVGNRNQRLVISLAFMELPDPSLQAAGVRGVGTRRRLQRTSGALNEQRVQVDVAAQTDMAQPCFATGAVLAWRQAKPGAELAPVRKTFASDTVAASALEVTGPTPSSSLARLATSLLLACVAICWSQRGSRRFNAANCSRTSSGSRVRTGSGSLVSSLSAATR